jgi:hypothetical protein
LREEKTSKFRKVKVEVKVKAKIQVEVEVEAEVKVKLKITGLRRKEESWLSLS